MVGRVSAPIALIIIRIMITMIKLLRDGWSHDEKTLRKSQGRSTPRRAAFGSYSQSPLTSQEHLCNVWLNFLILTFQSIRSCTRASIFLCLDLHSEDHRWVKLHPDQVHLYLHICTCPKMGEGRCLQRCCYGLCHHSTLRSLILKSKPTSLPISCRLRPL